MTGRPIGLTVDPGADPLVRLLAHRMRLEGLSTEAMQARCGVDASTLRSWGNLSRQPQLFRIRKALWGVGYEVTARRVG